MEFSNLENWTLSSGPVCQLDDDLYLGQSDHLFARKEDGPLPSWNALLWIGKDHPVSIMPPTGLLSNQRYMDTHLTTLVAPPSILCDSRFYASSLRRYPWKLDQKLDEVWYNFCLMEGEFDSPSNCSFWFKKFAGTIGIQCVSDRPSLLLSVPIGAGSITYRLTPELEPISARIMLFS